MGTKQHYLQSDLLNSHSGLTHAFFTRNGGHSTGIFKSLNFRPTKGEPLDHVRRNAVAAARMLGFDKQNLIVLKQQCRSRIISNPQKALYEQVGDACVTDRSDVALGIVTADCLPLLLYDPENRVAGACHGSANGLKERIVIKTLDAMIALGASTDTIFAAIGPCIHQDNYEVGAEIYQQFKHANPDFTQFFTDPHTDIGQRYLDLRGVAKHELALAGISSVEDCEQDTYTQRELFFSYRRNTHRGMKEYGDQLSMIQMESL